MSTTSPNLGLVLADDIAPNDDSIDVTTQLANNFSSLDTLLGNIDSDVDSVHTRLTDLETFGNRYQRRSRESTLSTSSDATLTSDAELSGHTLDSNAFYSMIGHLEIVSSATPDFKFQIAGPSGVVIRGMCLAVSGASDDVIQALRAFTEGSATGIPCLAGSGGTNMRLFFIGAVAVSSTAGTLDFQWSQNTSDAATTSVNRGFILLEKTDP